MAPLRLSLLPSSAPEVEIVERKGLGHPDAICDAVAERLSRALCRHYLDHFGRILHHNVDKALLVGGASHPAFGGGRVERPIELILAGRAVTDVGGVTVPVDEIAVSETRAWFLENMRSIDPQRDVKISCRIRAGSADLGALFARGRTQTPLANDTSCGTGYAPLSPLERYVLDLERSLNSTEFRNRFPWGGEDVKVMAVREGNGVHVTLARALVDRHLPNLHAYLDAKQVLSTEAARLSKQYGLDATISVNAADDPEHDSVYLTVTGTSAEAGDDGEVGRGNRQNGLITPLRPMSLEASAGKNPVSHVGKLYNLTANAIASDIVNQLSEASDAECCLVSRIGSSIAEPALTSVRVRLSERATLAGIEPKIQTIVRTRLAEIHTLWRGFCAGEILVA